METVKETKEYRVVKKRSGRFGVQTPRGKWINGEEKAKILVAEGLIKTGLKKEEAPAEAEAEAAADAPAEGEAEQAAE